MRWLSFLFMSALFLIASANPLDAETSEPKFVTEYGTMVGKQVRGSDVFLGVPFAKPPVNELRFKAPEPLEKSTEKEFQTKTNQPDCMQNENKDYKVVSEDCLYLNVFKPSTPKTKDPLPVLVFLPGGNFVIGGCSLDMYDATILANDLDAIVVCVNYRLGVFGFLYYDEEEADILGNFGLKDQMQALKFVKENIENLGGNPNKITLSGESAGAQSVAAHLTSEEDSDFFQQAILMSSPFSISLKPKEEALKLGEKFLKELDCEEDVTSCLYKSTAEDILEASNACFPSISDITSNLLNILQDLGSTFDGKVLHVAQPWGPTVEVQPVSLFKSVDKPVIIGTLSGESGLFPLQDLDKQHLLIFSFILKMQLGLKVNGKYKKWYEDGELISHFVTDYMFTCPSRQVALDMKSTSVYHYYFDHILSFGGEIAPPTCETHACHGLDLPFFFHSASLMNFTFTPDEEIMADKYLTYLANFIHYGDPNQISDNVQPAELSPWNPIDLNPGNTWTMVFSTKEPTASKQGIQKEQCDFLDGIGYYDVGRMNRK